MLDGFHEIADSVQFFGDVDALGARADALATSDAVVGLSEFWHRAIVSDKESASGIIVCRVGFRFHHLVSAQAFIVVNQNAGYVDAIGARHTVFAIVARDGFVVHDLLRDVFIEESCFLVGERAQRTVGA